MREASKPFLLEDRRSVVLFGEPAPFAMKEVAVVLEIALEQEHRRFAREREYGWLSDLDANFRRKRCQHFPIGLLVKAFDVKAEFASIVAPRDKPRPVVFITGTLWEIDYFGM